MLSRGTVRAGTLGLGARRLRIGLRTSCCGGPAPARPGLHAGGMNSRLCGFVARPFTRREQCMPTIVARGGFMREMQSMREPTATEFTWTSPLQVVPYPSPVLRAPNLKLEVANCKGEIARLAREMLDLMYRTDGCGLAAPQVGVNVRLMVFNPNASPGVKPVAEDEYILVNPVILKKGKQTDVFEEGCLSFPELYADVVRPTSIKVEYQTETGARQAMSLKGFPARVFQHEYDHLDGILFQDRMSPSVLADVRPKLAAMEKLAASLDAGLSIK